MQPLSLFPVLSQGNKVKLLTLLVFTAGFGFSGQDALARTADVSGQPMDSTVNPNFPGDLEPIPVPASDSKIYHGSECRYVDINNENSPEFYNNPVKYDTHGVFNQDAAITHVVCPVVRDNVTNTTGILEAKVAINNVADKEMWCQFISRDFFGQLMDLDQATTSSGGNQLLSLNVTVSAAYGNYSIYCKFPQGARIYSYGVTERLRTDSNN